MNNIAELNNPKLLLSKPCSFIHDSINLIHIKFYIKSDYFKSLLSKINFWMKSK